jgi:uncharacterized protein (DUF4415 family)
MPVKSKSGRSFVLPSDEEEKQINAGIKSDPDTYELTDKEFTTLRPVGRLKAEITKDRITIRLSPEVTKHFRAIGKGWQSKIDQVLKDYIAQNPLTK